MLLNAQLAIGTTATTLLGMCAVAACLAASRAKQRAEREALEHPDRGRRELPPGAELAPVTEGHAVGAGLR
jgi:hypothetical protein